MFQETFMNCQQLQSIPENLFSDVTDVAETMFASTFACYAIDEETGEFLSSSITSLPNSLFPNITGTPAEYMFTGMFYNCSNLSGYVPATLFENLDYAENAMPYIFFGTGLSSTCPDNTTQYITGFESDWYTTMNAETNEFTSYAVSCVSNSPSGLTCNAPNVELSILGAPMCQFGSQAGTDWTGNSVNNNLLPVSSEYSRHKVKKLTGSATTLLKRISTVTSYTRLPSFYSAFAECDNLSSVSNELFNLYNGTIGIYYPRTAMFAYTFYNCVNLNLSNNGALFNHIHNGAPELFANTFRGCSKLKYVSSDTFYGITDGYRSMFDGTFADCSSLVWPYTNFRVTNRAPYMFHSTFENCTSIRAFGPVVFAPDLTGVAAEGMYEDMFKGCTNLSGSVPTSLFANITPSSSSGNINPALYSMSGIFQGTNLDTQCPSNAIINTTGFEAAWTITDDNACVATDAPSNCEFAVSCTPCENGLAADATHTECIEPTYELFIDTTNDTESFDFSICADGVFFVDWGDGTKDSYNSKYEVYGCVPASHTYSSSGSYTISLGGRATDYDYTSVDRQVVSFSGDTEIAKVRGSLGGIFPVIKDANDNVIATPWFENTFTDCTNLTEISEDLFSGITTNEGNFNGTFAGCASLTEIPENLFSGISGDFGGTFAGCTSLTEIPKNLFSGISGYFSATFAGCTSLTEIPENLFSGISELSGEMFAYTFYGCTSLTHLPNNLFPQVSLEAKNDTTCLSTLV